MKGLGRNVKGLSSILLMSYIGACIAFGICIGILWLCGEEPLTLLKEIMPVYMVLVIFILTLLMAYWAESYCCTLVSLGSVRKTAAVGILISEHAFLVLHMGIVLGLASFAEKNTFMQMISACPIGTISVILLIVGVGFLLVSLNLKGHVVLTAILGVTLYAVLILLVGIVGTRFAIEMNKELLMPYNNWGLLAAGLAIDLLGAFVYYKTVTKVDLKLA